MNKEKHRLENTWWGRKPVVRCQKLNIVVVVVVVVVIEGKNRI
jgi:hypothetical protein